jgi:hypothetical protein
MFLSLIKNKHICFDLTADFGSNGIHVAPLLYSVTIWALSVVLEYSSETVFTRVFSYILATVLVIVIDYIF